MGQTLYGIRRGSAQEVHNGGAEESLEAIARKRLWASPETVAAYVHSTRHLERVTRRAEPEANGSGRPSLTNEHDSCACGAGREDLGGILVDRPGLFCGRRNDAITGRRVLRVAIHGLGQSGARRMQSDFSYTILEIIRPRRPRRLH